MCSRGRKGSSRVARNGVEYVLQIIKYIIRRTIRRTDPDPSNGGFLDPILVLLSEKPNLDQIVHNLASGYHAMKVSTSYVAGTATHTYNLSICGCDA
jgi:hypothetical protein